jgi:hypothetical protein
VIDVVTFRLVDGANPETFRALDERLQTEFFYHQPGLIRRTTALSEDGTWISISHWESVADVEAADAKTVDRNEFTPLLAIIDPSTIHGKRYDTV